MQDKHKWTKEDDIIVLYLSKYGVDDLEYTKQALSNYIGTSLASVEMRIKNFYFLAGKDGLPNVAKMTAEVYQEYNDVPQSVLRAEVIKIIQEKQQ